jgi:hypothetical protein
MRGSPIQRALLTFLILLGLAPVLWQMTRPVQRDAPTSAAATGTPVKIPLALAFTTAPRRVTISYIGQQVWQKDAPEAREECELDLVWPNEGGDLLFKIEWPEGTPLSAMRARLTPPKGSELERSLWGSGPVEKVLKFP